MVMAMQIPKMAWAMASGQMLRDLRKMRQAVSPQISVTGARMGLGKWASAKTEAAVTAAQVALGRTRTRRRRK